MAAVSKHEGVTAALILRDARTPVRALRDLPAGALLRMRTAEFAARRRTVFGHSHLTMSNSPSRSRDACLRPGFASLLHSPRIEGWAERRETFGCSGTRSACHLASKTRVNALMTRHTRRLRGALRPMTRDARLSALHRGGFGLRGRACLTGICAGSVTASSSHPGRSAWRAGSRASRGERLQAACRRTPRLAPHSGSFSRTRPQ